MKGLKGAATLLRGDTKGCPGVTVAAKLLEGGEARVFGDDLTSELKIVLTSRGSDEPLIGVDPAGTSDVEEPATAGSFEGVRTDEGVAVPNMLPVGDVPTGDMPMEDVPTEGRSIRDIGGPFGRWSVGRCGIQARKNVRISR